VIKLNYNELLKRYDEILLSTSRGFDTEHEFLESWVPNSDINQSISDLINAASDYGIKHLELILSEEKVNKLNVEGLKKRNSEFGAIEFKEGKIFFLSKA